MKEFIKLFYQEYKSFFEGVMVTLGIIAIFEWVIAPGLTTPNTIINILSLLLGLIIFLWVGIKFVWENLFGSNNTKSTSVKTTEEKTKKQEDEKI
jgi:hypothetical protein